MKGHTPSMFALAVVLSMALCFAGPAAADPGPHQAPTETQMMTAMVDAADWMITVVGTDGQMSPPPGSPSGEEESVGRLSINGLALLRAYQVTGDERYLDRAVTAGDLVSDSAEAGIRYVMARTGALRPDAGSGFPNVQSGKVDDTYQASYTLPMRFEAIDTLYGIWFLYELYQETSAAKYSDYVLELDRLIGQHFYYEDDPTKGLVADTTMDGTGNFTSGRVASTTIHATALYVISLAETSVPNLWRDKYDLITHTRYRVKPDGSFGDRVQLPNQDNDSEIKHALMVPALYDLGRAREARDLANWVKGRQRADGSFACPHDHDTPGDTFVATMNLLPVGEVTSGADGLSWIIREQSSDGSWEAMTGLDIQTSPMLNTQWAILALHAGLTNYNLYIDDGMVVATPVWEGDPARVMAFRLNITVSNTGLVDTDGVQVRVYDGPVGGGNRPVNETVVDVAALDSVRVELEFRPEARGPHDVHIWVVYPPGGEYRPHDNNVSFMVNLNREPTGTIESPTEGQLFAFGAEIAFSAAEVFDADDDLVNLTWMDNVTGILSHEDSFSTVLSPGEHLVVLTFADGNGPDTSVNVSFSVRHNIPPTIRISTPADGARYYDYAMVTMDASATSDAEDHNLTFTWESDRTGLLGLGPVVNVRLPAGPHHITVWVDDGWDNVSKSVSIHIIETYPPNIVISSPLDGATYVTTTRVEFDGGMTTDPDSEILEFFWYSNIDGKLSERPSFLYKLKVGHHRITLAVNDGNYNVSKTIEIDVMENRPPVAVISSPLPDSTFISNELIELNGSDSYDLEDPITFFWISDREGVLGNDPVISTYLRRGDHTITLWINDAHGHNISAMVTVEVINLGPTAGISSPEAGKRYLTGMTVQFLSDASSDPESDRLFYEWYLRPVDGDWIDLGTQSRTERVFTEAGEFEVRLVVSDGHEEDDTSVVFRVDAAPDQGDGEGTDNMVLYLVVGVLIVVIVAVIAFIAMRQRVEPY